jgi:hypothetical protein
MRSLQRLTTAKFFEFNIDQSTRATLVADAGVRGDAAERQLKSIRSATGPNQPAEPKRVRTFTIRPDQAGQRN